MKKAFSKRTCNILSAHDRERPLQPLSRSREKMFTADAKSPQGGQGVENESSVDSEEGATNPPKRADGKHLIQDLGGRGGHPVEMTLVGSNR